MTRTCEPIGKGTVVSTKHPPGPRSVVRVENRAPYFNSITSAPAVNMWRSAIRRSASCTAGVEPGCVFFLSDELCIALSLGPSLASGSSACVCQVPAHRLLVNIVAAAGGYDKAYPQALCLKANQSGDLEEKSDGNSEGAVWTGLHADNRPQELLVR